MIISTCTDSYYALREMITDEEIQDLDVWEPATVVEEDTASDETKADNQ